MRSCYTPVLWAIFVLTGIILLINAHNLYAVEIPPDGSVAFIQTSGPNAPLSNGDFYASDAADDQSHEIVFGVPCRWPASRPITVALFDPESFDSNTVLDIDEVKGDADDTTFALKRNGTILTTETYTPDMDTDGRWVELLTFRPEVDCATSLSSTYIIETTTSDNDEQSWRLRVGYDPDCGDDACSGIGATQSALLGNDNIEEDLDGIEGTGDELLVGLLQVSFQHASDECQTFYFQVDASASEVVLHNFDMDNRDSITYRTPTGREIEGTVSGESAWNNSEPADVSPERVGDVIAVEPGEGGVWSATACTGADNQYIFEGQQDAPIFYEQPPTPRMEITKDNGVAVVRPNDLLTYTLAFTNTSGTSNAPGAAARVNLTDQLPEDTTFVACEIDAPFTGTCVQNGEQLDIAINELVTAPGENSGSVQVTVRVNPGAEGTDGILRNTVTLEYQDVFDNNYSAVQAEDTDEIENSAVITATKDDSLLVDNDGNNKPSAGDILQYTIVMTNVGNLPADDIIFDDTPDANTTLVPGTVASSQGDVTIGNGDNDTMVEVAIGAVPVRNSVMITFQVQINTSLPSDVDQVVNQGIFTDAQETTTLTDDPGTPGISDDSTRTPLVPSLAPAPPTLEATKSVVTLDSEASAPCQALVDETLQHTVLITNSDGAAATLVNFVDTPDARTRLVPSSVATTQGTVLSGNAAGDAQVQVNIGTLESGSQVEITYQVMVLDLSANQTVLENQGRVNANELSDALLTDDPTTVEQDDPTQTLACVPGTTAIELLQFTATRPGATIRVRWVTGTELDTWGFHLYRSPDNSRANAVQVTSELIVGQGRGQEQTVYTWIDRDVVEGTSYTYWLQEIELDGSTHEYGPAGRIAPQRNEEEIFLPIVIR